jgi:hypothetical protein
MQGSASNCSIHRITLGTLPLEHEELIDELRDLARESGETDPKEEPRRLLYRWLEDKDDRLYFDGPIYDESIQLHLGDLSFSIREGISSGSRLTIVQKSVVRAPSKHILAHTDMGGNGSLGWLSICGDEGALSSLCESGSVDDIGAIAKDLEILVKQWKTPIGDLAMFVGIAFRAEGSYEWNEQWGDGSYESEVNSQEADLLKMANGSFKPMAEDRVDSIITEVCAEFE